MAAEVVTFGSPSVTPFADPVTFNEVFRLVQVQRFAATVTCMNTFHFGTGTTGNSEASLVTDWATNIVPTWKATVSSQMTFTEVAAQRIVPQSAVSAMQLTGPGTQGGVAAPCPTAGVITWRTQLLGRRRRGRTYVPGLAYTAAAEYGNQITWGATQIARLTTLATAILNRYTLGGNPYGFQLIVWSRTTAFEPDQIDWRLGASMVTRFSVQSYIATMGSRRGGRGI